MNSNVKKHATGKRFLFLAAALVAVMFTFTQCDKISELFDKPTKPTSSCDQKVIICNTLFENTSNQLPVNIMEMEIVGDCLKIKISASGCDGSTWVVKLIDSDKVYFSTAQIFPPHPPVRDVRLSLYTEEFCRALITKEISFNIKDLRVKGHNKVRLSLSDIPEDVILYEY